MRVRMIDGKIVLSFNIFIYHGTKRGNVLSIIENGFTDEANTAVVDIKYAYYYWALKFRYEYKIQLKDLFWFLKNYYTDSRMMICVNNYKPKNVVVIPLDNKNPKNLQYNHIKTSI